VTGRDQHRAFARVGADHHAGHEETGLDVVSLEQLQDALDADRAEFAARDRRRRGLPRATKPDMASKSKVRQTV
jgi:hypothetical protein